MWLARNYGQHAATLAGMASSGGEWIVTLDEDGQHDPADIPAMLDRAMDEQVGVVYARPVNGRQHGWFRNTTSGLSKRLIDLLASQGNTEMYHSYRLMLGEAGRGVAAYAGRRGLPRRRAGLGRRPRASPARSTLRAEGTRPSGYGLRSLLSHFWRLVLTSGTRLLRLVAVVGALFALVGIAFAGAPRGQQARGGDLPPGWTSVMVAVLIGIGAVMLTLGIVAEYLGVAVDMAMGKPLYLITLDPLAGPLGRPPGRHRAGPPSDPAPPTWVLGARGLLGSHVVDALRRRGSTVLTVQVPWRDRQGTRAALADGVRRLEAGGRRWRRGSSPGAPGAGVVATTAAAMDEELAAFSGLLEELAARPALARRGRPVRGLVGRRGLRRLVGSAPVHRGLGHRGAGALRPHQARHGARRTPLRATAPAPPCSIGRIANLYGPGQNLAKAQGLVSQLSRAHLTGVPVPSTSRWTPCATTSTPPTSATWSRPGWARCGPRWRGARTGWWSRSSPPGAA